jgi:chemotaxis protein methyltransferase CheR
VSASLNDALSERDHRRVAAFIEGHAGIQLPASKRSLIEGRLRKRQRALGYGSLHAYIDHALDTAGEGERLHLLDALTTNKTDFYREADHFRYLRQHVLGELAAKRAAGWQRPLRIWSAGCSSGEEPYTLAIELLELRRELPGLRFEIVATDISASSLEKARRGIYPHSRVEPIPLPLRKRYLLRSRDRKQDLVRIAPEVREQVSFDSFNLLTDAYDFSPKFDLIFCRNVMIYFNQADRSQIAHRFAATLQPGGLLFIGHSETLNDTGAEFVQQVPTIYRASQGVRR